MHPLPDFRQVPTPTRKLTPRQLVAAIAALEARRVDLGAVGQPTKDVDRQLVSARIRLKAGEYNVPPEAMGVGR